MPPVKKITILELAPCADTLLGIRRDPEEGYASADRGMVAIRSGARLRPQVLSINAGGKATNVAGVMDRLLGARDEVEVELVVFRPDSAEGRYIAELQARELTHVKVRSVIVESTARFCINLSDPASPASSRVEFNLSPRVIWQPDAVEAAVSSAGRITTDLLLLAGNPPAIAPECKLAAGLPASILGTATGAAAISIDIEKGALAHCLEGRRQPDVVKINHDEYLSVDSQHWATYRGTLVVTDDDGCTAWEPGPTGGSVRIGRPQGHLVFSTVGAGDAAHAGFTMARWVWGFDIMRAAQYAMATSAAAVSSPEGTRGVAREDVERFFHSAYP
jgi:fructose-1-phosphate kinase PfkB-like protein